MQRQHRNRLTGWQATLTDTVARMRRPKVTSILCQHCNKWVKPRRYDPTVYACKPCAPRAAHAYYRARRAAADNAKAQRRALDEQLAELRHEARVTTAR